jgi:hypothetical protein
MPLRGQKRFTQGGCRFAVLLLLVLHLAVAGVLSAFIFQIYKEREATKQLEALGWSVQNEPRTPSWLWRNAGKDRIETVTEISICTMGFFSNTFLSRANDSLPWLRCLPNLKRVDLNECGRPADDIDAATAYLRRKLPGVSIEGWRCCCCGYSGPLAAGEEKLMEDRLRHAREQLLAARGRSPSFRDQIRRTQDR